MHFCTCSIRVGGDYRTVVPRDIFNPVSWPEIEVLLAIHGDDAVLDAKPFISVEQDVRKEKERLALKYGFERLESIFPGRNPNMTMEAPNTRLPPPPPVWFNPLDPEPAGFDVPPEDRAPPATEAPKPEIKMEPRVESKVRELKGL